MESHISTKIKNDIEIEEYVIDTNMEDLNPKISMPLNSKTYIRTDRYGISLVGKKITIGIAATAIVAATPYIGISVAVKIITSAISAGIGGGVQSLPNYLYVVSNVYTSRATGKIYTRYENRYYLDSARSQYVGFWIFSKRWGR